MAGRRIERAARAWADQQTEDLAETPTTNFLATVTVVSPLTVSWRGSAIVAAGRYAAYTPGLGDRVACSLIDGQVVVEDRIV